MASISSILFGFFLLVVFLHLVPFSTWQWMKFPTSFLWDKDRSVCLRWRSQCHIDGHLLQSHLSHWFHSHWTYSVWSTLPHVWPRLIDDTHAENQNSLYTPVCQEFTQKIYEIISEASFVYFSVDIPHRNLLLRLIPSLMHVQRCLCANCFKQSMQSRVSSLHFSFQGLEMAWDYLWSVRLLQIILRSCSPPVHLWWGYKIFCCYSRINYLSLYELCWGQHSTCMDPNHRAVLATVHGSAFCL